MYRISSLISCNKSTAVILLPYSKSMCSKAFCVLSTLWLTQVCKWSWSGLRTRAGVRRDIWGRLLEITCTISKNLVNKDTEISQNYLAMTLQWELWLWLKPNLTAASTFMIHRITDPTTLSTNYPIPPAQILSFGQKKAACYQAWQREQVPAGEFRTVGCTWRNKTRFSASPALYTSFYYSAQAGYLLAFTETKFNCH